MDKRNGHYLIIKEKQKTLYRVPLYDNFEYRIGRDLGSADIVLDHARISRRHCSVRYDTKKDCIWVKDYSANGCSIAGNVPLIQNVAVKVEMQEEIQLTGTDIRIFAEKKNGLFSRLLSRHIQ